MVPKYTLNWDENPETYASYEAVRLVVDGPIPDDFNPEKEVIWEYENVFRNLSGEYDKNQ